MKYEKLVRDKIPEMLDKKQIPYEKRIADDLEYKNELIKKLGEEAQEFLADKSVEELADVLEVIDALKKLPEFANVLLVQAQKKAERGGFDSRIIAKGDDGK